MEIKNVIYREIAGECLLIPTGEAVKSNNGVFALTDVAGLMFRLLQDGKTPDEIAVAVTQEYETDKQTVLADLEKFIEKLKNLGFAV